MVDQSIIRNSSPVRGGVSLIETVVVILLIAIGAAVATPKWTQALDRTRVASMRKRVQADVAALRRIAVCRGKEVTLSITIGSQSLSFAPAAPEVLGNATGSVVYSLDYPGVIFSAVNLGGTNTCKINIYGELVSNTTGNPLTNALLTLAGASSSRTIDLLVQEGTTSAAAPP